MVSARPSFAEASADVPVRSELTPGGCSPADDVVPILRRKRGAALEDAIHDAVFAELAQVGYAGFTIEAVAARAQTGKASIYRRWPTKPELVIDAFCSRFGGPEDLVDEPPADASTRDILLQVARRIVVVSGAAGEVIRAVACEVTRDDALADAIDKRVHCQKRAALIAILRRGVDRGEVRADAADEVFADVLPALLMYQTILLNRPMTEDCIVDIVDRIMVPLLAP